MRFPLGLNVLFFSFFLSVQAIVFAQDFPPVPNPPRLVNDFAGVLSSDQVARLETKLSAYNDSTSSQIAVVLIKSVGPYDISDYAFQLGDLWGIGGGENDNGILILGAMDDREVFIATGYGLEGAVPDALAKRIVTNLIIPNFKKEDYYTGLDQATDMIIKLASGEYQAEEVMSDGNSGGALIVFLLFIVIFVVLPMLKNRNDNNNHMGGRGGGVDLWTTIMLANMLKGSGGKFGDFSSGGGSFGGGGGFGGFGGGSFGGGGAGGSW
ncbi:TPM domain-containing protein [Algoriphagus sp.]|uniref:TPM domain-containing protein n=1 Tax=Algoriphagus sp. TaxID=1872435 RepID=UPI00263880A7|nr:TPM domain-containing protein [Algoriphagus sp.]